MLGSPSYRSTSPRQTADAFPIFLHVLASSLQYIDPHPEHSGDGGRLSSSELSPCAWSPARNLGMSSVLVSRVRQNWCKASKSGSGAGGAASASLRLLLACSVSTIARFESPRANVWLRWLSLRSGLHLRHTNPLHLEQALKSLISSKTGLVH